jgi:predicted DsbA family dithiol-disulfide isomerase
VHRAGQLWHPHLSPESGPRRAEEKLDYIQQVRDTGNQKYDIRSTPTLIINGQKLEGNQSISALQQVIDPMLNEAEES